MNNVKVDLTCGQAVDGLSGIKLATHLDLLILWMLYCPCVFEGLFDFQCPPVVLISEVNRQLHLTCSACGDRKANQVVGREGKGFQPLRCQCKVAQQKTRNCAGTLSRTEKTSNHQGRRSLSAIFWLHLSVCLWKSHSSTSSSWRAALYVLVGRTYVCSLHRIQRI